MHLYIHNSSAESPYVLSHQHCARTALRAELGPAQMTGGQASISVVPVVRRIMSEPFVGPVTGELGSK